MNHKLIDLPLLARFKDKFERKFDKKLEDLNAEIDEKFGEVNANLDYTNLKADDLNKKFQQVISGFATSLSGSRNLGYIDYNESVTVTITFSKTFSKIPTVIATAIGYTQDSNRALKVTITSKTQGGFSATILNNNVTHTRVANATITWNATA